MQDFADQLFQLLLREIDAPDTNIHSDMSVTTARRVSLARAIKKKYLSSENTDSEQDRLCLEKFIEYNTKCASFKLVPTSLFEDVVINQMKSILDGFFFSGPDSTFGLSEIFLGGNVGPGASVGSEENSFYTKLFDSPLTSTSLTLNRLYRSMIACHPTWSDAENARFRTHGDTIVAGSRLSFVPKTSEISRSICTEPVLNMFFQKGIGCFLEGCLRQRYNIDLSVQPSVNRKLAKLGSIDGSFATIDLSSASDSISRSLVAEIFPPYFVRFLDYARSPSTLLPTGSIVELHMISSMGNGFTFPLQTLIFASLVEACYTTMGLPLRDQNKQLRFGVFGDDIIVEKSIYEFVCKMLERCGFTVNVDKSFNSGYFRESCGADYYRGIDIRGVYVKQFRDDADVYSAFNRLTRWSAASGVDLECSLLFLYKTARKKLHVPFIAGDSEGFKVPRIVADVRLCNLNTRSDGYQALVLRTSNLTFPDSDAVILPFKPPYRKFTYNGSGLLLGVVAGYIRDGRSSTRLEKRAFRILWRFIPYWDYIPEADKLLFVGDGGWEATVEAVLALR